MNKKMTINGFINTNLDQLNELTSSELRQRKLLEMVQRRNHVIQFDVNAPKYLLEPEIKQFFDFVDNYNELILFKLLWITGARISEALLLKPANFVFGIDSCLMSLPTQKKRKLVRKEEVIDENGVRQIKKLYESTRGVRHIEITKNNNSQRDFIGELNRYIVTNKIGKNSLLFNYTRFQVYRMMKKIQSVAEAKGVVFPFEITPHTFRHSCAMNLVYNNVNEQIIQKYLGHSRIDNTRKYMEIFHLEYDISHVNF